MSGYTGRDEKVTPSPSSRNCDDLSSFETSVDIERRILPVGE